jgi:DNA-binding LacI/PurR family transcriptional regulator
VARCLYRSAARYGYEVLLSATTPDRDERRAVDTLLGYRSEALVPRDVSVAGFEDTPMAGLAHVDLTSVAQDVDRTAGPTSSFRRASSSVAARRRRDRVVSPPAC